MLDAYALLGAVAVTAMLLWPRLYYSHYGAFEGPFLALAVALPAGLLTARPDAGRAKEAALPAALPAVVAAVLVTVLVAMGIGQFRAESGTRGIQVTAEADRLIPPGACVVTNDAPFTVAADRFFSSRPGCPAMVDPFGTFFAMTGGDERRSSAVVLAPVVALWHDDAGARDLCLAHRRHRRADPVEQRSVRILPPAFPADRIRGPGRRLAGRSAARAVPQD